jgi:hypothetical protein
VTVQLRAKLLSAVATISRIRQKNGALFFLSLTV